MMPALSNVVPHRRSATRSFFPQERHRRIAVLVRQAQGPSGFGATPEQYAAISSPPTQQPAGIYYGSNPPQNFKYGQGLQSEPQYLQQRQQQTPQQAPPTAYQSAQRTAYPPQGPGAGATVSSGLTPINPGRGYINSVRLMGSILQPERQGRCTSAIIHVPYATKEGGQDFVLEAWNEEAALLLGLHGAQVLVDGRLARDAVMGVTKVVANSIQLVDLSLPVTSYRGGQAGERRTAAPALDPQQVWRTHYTSSTQTLKALAAHFGVQPSTISRSLLPYAFQSSSPLHWRVLAEEVGLGPKDDLRLGDFMDLVTKYKEDVAAMYGEAKPGAAPPPMPTTAEGILKVKPIREWALAKPETDLAFYTVKQYEAQHGMPMLYEALRMAVVAEATQGVWNYQVEFGSGVEA